ncbi:ABC transporter ATP-binding protein [Enterococcus sp. LJL99]
MKKKKRIKLKLLATVFTALSAGMAVLVAFLMKLILDCAMEKDLEALKRSIGISVLYILAYFIVNYLKEVVVSTYTKEAIESLRSKAYSAIMNKSYQDFYDKSSGEYISVLTNDMTTLEENYFKSYFLIVQSAVTFVIAVLSLFIINWQFSLGVIAISTIFLGMSSFTGIGLNKLRVNIQTNMADFTSKTKDLVSGYEVIRSFHAQEKMKNEFDVYNKKLESTKLKFNVRQGITKVVNENLVILIVFSIMILGSWFVINGNLVMGSLLAVIQLLNSVMNPINILLLALNNSKSTEDIRTQLDELLDSPQEHLEKSVVAKNDFQQGIDFQGVDFSYDGGNKVINDFHFRFEKGKKYAITGKSGCGKSTLLKLIQNYYGNYNGKIAVDDLEYQKIEGDSFFNLFSTTHQNVFIFSGTIRDNITLYNAFDEGQIEWAVKSSGLQNLVDGLPLGLDTPIQENGQSLSGGEKQRISIARALIRQAPILLLDEFTSALDKKTAEVVEKEILELTDQTCIHVTHKLTEASSKLYDAVLVMNAGGLEKVIHPKIAVM